MEHTVSVTTEGDRRDADDRTALLRLGAVGVAVGCLLGIGTAVAENSVSGASVIAGIGAAVAVFSFAAARRYTGAASMAFVMLVTMLITIVSAIFGNRYAATASLDVLVVMLAGLLISRRAAWVTCAGAVAGAAALFILDVQGRLPDVNPSPVKRVAAIVVSVVVATLLFTASLQRLHSARDEAKKKADELARMKASLESTVEERTRSLVQARDAAAAASRAKTAFLANMSHELRTPLNAIVGITSLMHARERPAEESEWIGTIQKSSEALLAVLNDVLDLARLEAGRTRVKYVPCSPRDIVNEVARTLQPQTTAAQLRLVVEVDQAVPHQVATDPMRLRQVLLNLMGNAVKFSLAPSARGSDPSRSEIRLKVRPVGAGLRFDVIDGGCGIAPELQSRLFHPFVQGDTSSTRPVGGAGLGLAICRDLVDLLGGDIDVESALGAGARFTFTIRAETTHGELPAPASLELPTIRGADSLRVLVVEDNPVNRTVMELLLTRLGLHPLSVDGGAAALQHLREHTVDSVLLDVQMPVIDGLEVVRQVRLSPRPHPWLIAVTANALPEEEIRARAAGIDAYLTKPVRLEVLARTLAQAVDVDRVSLNSPQ